MPGSLLEVLDFAPLVREFYRRSRIEDNLVIYTRAYQAEGDRLRFVGGRFRLHQEPQVWRVSVDLTNGTVEEDPVPPRPASPGI